MRIRANLARATSRHERFDVPGVYLAPCLAETHCSMRVPRLRAPGLAGARGREGTRRAQRSEHGDLRVRSSDGGNKGETLRARRIHVRSDCNGRAGADRVGPALISGAAF